MNKQMNFDELMTDEFRKQELKKPPFLQLSSAPLVRFNGDKADLGSLAKGTLGHVVGSLSGEFNTAFHSGRAFRNVRYIDLEPMKVTEFSQEEKEMSWPKPYEYVKVISNATMCVVDEGILTTLLPDKCCLTDRLANGSFEKESNSFLIKNDKGWEFWVPGFLIRRPTDNSKDPEQLSLF